MATLTGYKAVNDATDGQQNPVFVFDEVDIGDAGGRKGNNDDNEIFVDAASVGSLDDKVSPTLSNGQISTDNDNQHQRATDNQRTTTPNNDLQVTSENNKVGSDAEIQKTDQQKQQQQRPSSETPTLSKKQQEPVVTIDMKQAMSAPVTPIGNRKNGYAITNNQQKQAHKNHSSQHSLSPSANDPSVDSISVSGLNLGGAGKSPRTPRRSPLMALFRGKPRESTRKMYTDEDQFEIEWANVFLEVQQKWYQKLSVTSVTSSLCGSNRNNIDKPQKPKLILNSLNGRIKSGEITAILGPSGSGKTSLLHSLFGKHRTAIQGSIKVTGAPTKKHLTVCTIPQNDYLIGHLTTQEALWFASRLKNTENDFNHDKNIERVIELLGLQRCRDTRINKLSGGQYKRVSIAQEMLSSPDILVLDEPTSGLDSLTCYRTVKVLRDLVEASKAHNLVNPMSIVLTIHQPHREVLDLFHSAYIMAVGGQCLYQGPPNEMESTINQYSGVNMPRQGYNPASFMVEIASEEYGREPISKLVESAEQKFRSTSKHNYSSNGSTSLSTGKMSGPVDSLAKLSYSNKKGDSTMQLYPLQAGGDKSSMNHDQDHYVDVDLDGNSIHATSTLNNKSEIDSRIMTPRSGKNSDGVFWTHVSLMAKRAFLSNLRDPLLCTIRIGAHIFIPLVVALIYGPRMGIPNGCPFYQPEINLLEYASMGVEEIQEKHDDIRIQFQNVGLHFMVYYAFGLCMLAFTAISFPLIMHVLIKEIRNGWYSLATFIIGKMLAELPASVLLPPISVGIIYVMTGQPSSYLQWRYLVQSLILILIIMIAEAKGLIFGAVCMNSMQTAVFSASVSTVPFILLSGFLIRIREVPHILQRLSFLSYFKHSVEALIITRYGFNMCPCDPELIPPGGTPIITGVPRQIMSLTDYYINEYTSSGELDDDKALTNSTANETNIVGNIRNIDKIVESTTTLSPKIDNIEPKVNKTNEEAEVIGPPEQGKFFNKLAQLLTRANAFGHQIKSCEDVEPFTMKDMQLKNDRLARLIGYLFIYIVILKFISYFIVEICVKLKL